MNEGPLAAASSFDRGGSAGYQTRARSRAPSFEERADNRRRKAGEARKL